jgi:hypothetical protein
MKTILKASIIFLIALLTTTGCEDLERVTPVPNTTSSNLTANFLAVNASPDAPSLDLYINNVLTGASVSSGQAQTGYANVPITTNGVGANTNISAKATSGSIGGILGSNNLIFRAGNANTNNFVAAAGGSYTLIVIDSINRPIPIRTVNDKNFGDTTFYSPQSSFTAKKKTDGVTDTIIQLSVGSNNPVTTARLLRKYNKGKLPSFFLPIGTVPLGSSDVGGLRFLLYTDNLPIPAIPPATVPVFPVPSSGKFAVRFINASPDAGTATAYKIGTTSVTGSFTYPVTQANFNPSVGSRSTTGTAALTAAFINNFAATGTYDITVTVGTKTVTLPAQIFADGGIYTIVLSGRLAKNNLVVTLLRNK